MACPEGPTRRARGPENAHCPTPQIKTSPAGHRTEVIEPCLGFRLPDARLKTKPLQLRSAIR
jgi:hypothetical protein